MSFSRFVKLNFESKKRNSIGIFFYCVAFSVISIGLVQAAEQRLPQRLGSLPSEEYMEEVSRVLNQTGLSSFWYVRSNLRELTNEAYTDRNRALYLAQQLAICLETEVNCERLSSTHDYEISKKSIEEAFPRVIRHAYGLDAPVPTIRDLKYVFKYPYISIEPPINSFRLELSEVSKGFLAGDSKYKKEIRKILADLAGFAKSAKSEEYQEFFRNDPYFQALLLIYHPELVLEEDHFLTHEHVLSFLELSWVGKASKDRLHEILYNAFKTCTRLVINGDEDATSCIQLFKKKDPELGLWLKVARDSAQTPESACSDIFNYSKIEQLNPVELQLAYQADQILFSDMKVRSTFLEICGPFEEYSLPTVGGNEEDFRRVTKDRPLEHHHLRTHPTPNLRSNSAK